ncbi:oxygenase MpaB family protein [Streptomyces yerevanensis]|uniref:oxygenase MpaB family protein n=1 Tax=Streptomyces yerevanensis TaxID=66378 RepID=UPI00068F094E|nr:oxygenase MpaB family protein [Streptomyces yerevanensis]
MDAKHTPRKAPERVVDLDAARRRHGAEADHVVTLLTAGDPLADAVIAELDFYGPRARRALDAGLRRGLPSLGQQPPAAIGALLKHLEATPTWVDPLLLHKGDAVSLSVPPMWFGLCSITGALAHSYASPATARLLAATDRPADMAAALRLAETGVWARQTIRPGGLLRGRPGYLATVELRLAHARMRATSLTDWDRGTRGLPIGQLDMARTWLGFTLIAFQALTAVGIDITDEEERRLYQYWSYVAHLLGLDESLYKDVVDHVGARRLQDLLDATTGAPDEHSTALTAAMVDAQAHAMAGAPGAVLSEEQLRHLIDRVLRRAFGEEWGDLLGIPGVPAATDLMPLIGQLNRQAHYWQTYSSASAPEARRRTLEESGPELRTAAHSCDSSCRRTAGAVRPGAWAA